jgi:uncharacterized membrane protein YhaH (DUF805 family)
MVSLLFAFNGRISRKQYIIGMSAATAVYVVLLFVLQPLIEAAGFGPMPGIGLALGLSLWMEMALFVKRYHDTGRGGYLVNLSLGTMFFLLTLAQYFFIFCSVEIKLTVGEAANWMALTTSPPAMLTRYLFIAIALVFKSDPAKNMFGPPPDQSWFGASGKDDGRRFRAGLEDKEEEERFDEFTFPQKHAFGTDPAFLDKSPRRAAFSGESPPKKTGIGPSSRAQPHLTEAHSPTPESHHHILK